MTKKNIHTPYFPDFKSVDISDKDCITSFAYRYDAQCCEYNFANLFCWQDSYQLVWSIYQDRLVVYSGVDHSFLMPLGAPMSPEELYVLTTALASPSDPCEVHAVAPGYLDSFPRTAGYYEIQKQRAYADYLYSVDKLVELKGKKLQKKKNLISQFRRHYPDYTVSSLHTQHIDQVRMLADRLFKGLVSLSDSLIEEHQALMTALSFFDALGLEGRVLWVKGRPVAFSIFSALNGTTYDIHFEKADLSFKGSAQAINHDTARFLQNRCRFLNREQDLGIPGLRQAKLSYDPDRILALSTLSVQTVDQTHTTTMDKK